MTNQTKLHHLWNANAYSWRHGLLLVGLVLASFAFPVHARAQQDQRPTISPRSNADSAPSLKLLGIQPRNLHATAKRQLTMNTAMTAAVCPFCSAIALTFTEQLNSNEIAVIAKLVELPPPPVESEDGYLDFPKGTFVIEGVLKGEKLVKPGMKFKTPLVGTHDLEQKFLVMGVNPPRVAWTTPMRASDRVFRYLQEIQKLPESGPDRLDFFQDFFEDKEAVLAFDAYDEFAKASYEDLIGLKNRMDRDQLLKFIDDKNTTVNRRRLYLTMLGVCGTKEDADILEGYLTSGNRKLQGGLDALIACYLMLKGEAGVALVEEKFLKDDSVDYVDVVATVMALRFHATETNVIPKQRIVEAVRTLLDRPKMADMIIADLARWKDWTVMERLVKMFVDAEEDSNWIRVPVITYLRACPDPKAAKYIEDLRKIDPTAVERADFFIGFGEDEDDDWGDDEGEAANEPAADAGKSAEPEQPQPDAGPTPPAVKPTPPVVKPTPPVVKPKGEEQGGGSAGSPSPEDPGESGGRSNAGLVQRKTQAADLQIELPLNSQDRFSVAQGDPIVVQPVAGSDVSNVEMPTDSTSTTHVSTSLTSDNRADAPTPTESAGDLGEETGSNTVAEIARENERLAATSTTGSNLAKEAPTPNLTMRILLVPFLGSIVILVTMWSVVNGWFERLIY